MCVSIVGSVWKEVDKFANARQSNRTYIEGPKDPDQVLLSSRNLVPVAFGEDESGMRISFALLGHRPGQSAAVESS